MIKRLAAAATFLAASAAPAFAHLDPAEHGSLMAGVSHPLFGADHILAMVAVGLWAALLAPERVIGVHSGWCPPPSSARWRLASPPPCLPAAALRRAGHPRLGRRHRPAGGGRAQRAGRPRHGDGRLLRLLPRPCAWRRTRRGRRADLRHRLRALDRAPPCGRHRAWLGLGRAFGGERRPSRHRLAGGATALGGLWLAFGA